MSLNCININTAYGIEFGTNHIVVKFPVVNDIEICIVEIKPGLKPLYTEMTNKNGVKTKTFMSEVVILLKQLI